MDADFSLLPGDPERFFELTRGGFDRKELKRRYTRLLKHYKPERHPEEFQLLRAAYEQLSQRFSTADRRSARPPSRRDRPPTSERSTEEDRDGADPFDPVAESTPAERYRELAERGHASPRHALMLGLISEVLDDPPRGFLEHVIAGLRSFPEAWLLVTAAERWLLERVEAAASAESFEPVVVDLELLAESLPAATFYRVTERVWIALASVAGATAWEQAFARCERRIVVGDDAARLPFMVRLLGRSVFHLGEDWIVTELGWLQSQHDLAGFMEDEVDLIEALVGYRVGRSTFLSKSGSVRSRVDQLIRAECERSSESSGAEFLADLYEFAEHPRRLRSDLPPRDPTARSALRLFSYFTWRAERRTLRDGLGVSGRDLTRRVGELVRAVHASTSHGRIGSAWGVIGPSVAFLTVVMVFLISVLIMALLPIPREYSIAVIAGVGVCGYVTRKSTVTRLEQYLYRRVARYSYRKAWRAELFRFFEHTRAEWFETLRVIDRIDDRGWLLEVASEDPGLQFYALASRHRWPEGPEE